MKGLEPDIVAVAERQHGVVSRRQALDAGVPQCRIDGHVRTGRLRPRQRGVYEIPGMATSHAPYMAACLASGPGAVLAGRTAGYLWQLPDLAAPELPEVLVAGMQRSQATVTYHRVRAFADGERTVHDGLAVTTPARTLLDLASRLHARRVEQSVAYALREGLVSEAEIVALMALRPRHGGTRLLRQLLDGPGGPALTRSPAEDRMLRLIEQVTLPRPHVNARIGRLEVDFFWPEQGFVLEVDGYEHHGTPEAFQADRRRDATLTAAGLRVMRVTWKQITEDPITTMVRLTQGLLTPRA
jgi:very-short-patch-repair endonuclease